MKRVWVAMMVGCVALGFASFASAGNNAQAGIAVHIGPEQLAKNICTSAGSLGAHGLNVWDGCLGEYSVYILVCNGSHRNAELVAAVGGPGFTIDGTGVAGADLGITYGPGLVVNSYFKCADLDFLQPGWPLTGTGAVFTWDSTWNCQGVPTPTTTPNEVMAVAAVLNISVTSPEALLITPNPSSGEAAVVDCNAVNDRLDLFAAGHLGAAGFCIVGYSPCGVVTPVEETTWGAIKKQFD